MIILHNSLDKDSRNFLAATLSSLGTTLEPFSGGVSASMDAKHIVYDWYRGGREAFWAAGHTDKVSAFPSVIVDIPTHRIPPIVGPEPVPGRTAPRRQHALRKPANVAAITTALTEINVRLAKSASEGLPVSPLTLDNMSDAKT